MEIHKCLIRPMVSSNGFNTSVCYGTPGKAGIDYMPTKSFPGVPVWAVPIEPYCSGLKKML